MKNDDFMKLFTDVQDRFDQMDEKFTQATNERQEIRTSVAELGGQIKDYRQEMLMLSHHVEGPES